MIKNTIISFILVLWLSTLNGWKVAGLEKTIICLLLILCITFLISGIETAIKNIIKAV